MPDPRTMTGGEVIAHCLKALGCGPMFGMGGFQLLPFYEGARVLGLQHHLINDERSGCFAADAYARVTGRPGVVDATLGPGATNLVTGLTESMNAGIALIALVGDTTRQHSWKNMTQETRQVEILRPAVKEVIRIEMVERIPELVERAFAVATSGRPGPVVLDVPEDISHATLAFDPEAYRPPAYLQSFPSHRSAPGADALRQAAALLAKSKRPLILAGGGVHISGAHSALTDFAREFQAPVATTMSGKGAVDETGPYSVGVFGRYSRIANDLLQEADCLLVVGCKMGEIATKRFGLGIAAPLIHLDSLAEEFGRTTRPDVALWADAREGLLALADALREAGAGRAIDRKTYFEEIETRKAAWIELASDRLNSTERPVNMGRLVRALKDGLPKDSIVVADGGFAAHWTSLLYDVPRAGRGYVANRGMASIGYGLPGAIGCKLAAPQSAVVAVTGDGGFNMTMGELETAIRAKAELVVVVVNNAASGYIKALQHAMYGQGAYQSSDLVEMDYAAIARAMGCHGERVDDPEQLDAALQRALAHRGGPSVLDVVVTRDPSKMLPAADSRTLKVEGGDRPI